ncbi:hypothetical protein GQ54DRAFT_300830 [Martensiomyces pterosporus]|nr:hypothetical protein GQ54DRAFT_300830 [Martensiomyces pterosporus]
MGGGQGMNITPPGLPWTKVTHSWQPSPKSASNIRNRVWLDVKRTAGCFCGLIARCTLEDDTESTASINAPTYGASKLSTSFLTLDAMRANDSAVAGVSKSSSGLLMLSV